MQKLPIKAFSQPQEHCFQTSWIFNAFRKNGEGGKRTNTDIFIAKYFNICNGLQNTGSEASLSIVEANAVMLIKFREAFFIATEVLTTQTYGWF